MDIYFLKNIQGILMDDRFVILKCDRSSELLLEIFKFTSSLVPPET
jgi:hypothetical protein